MRSYTYSNEMKNILSHLRSKDPIYVEAYLKAVEFLKALDAIKKTAHQEIFVRMFDVENPKGKSVDGFALEEHYAERTLYRYCHKYVDCIMYFVHELQDSKTPPDDHTL